MEMKLVILVIGKEVYEEEELSWCEEKKACNKCSEVARRGGCFKCSDSRKGSQVFEKTMYA
jgi:hypothetical protein